MNEIKKDRRFMVGDIVAVNCDITSANSGTCAEVVNAGYSIFDGGEPTIVVKWHHTGKTDGSRYEWAFELVHRPERPVMNGASDEYEEVLAAQDLIKELP